MQSNLGNVKLFNNIIADDLSAMLSCLGVKYKKYEKRSIIVLAEDNADHVGIVLGGAVLIVKEDFVGNRSIVDRIGQYDMFGEAFACAGIQKSPVTVVAAENCEIMWIQFRRIINTCSANCVFHSKLIENMMKLLALKNIQMNQKLEITSKRNLRDKQAYRSGGHRRLAALPGQPANSSPRTNAPGATWFRRLWAVSISLVPGCGTAGASVSRWWSSGNFP
jgi:CRP-like cAMP-binding protein